MDFPQDALERPVVAIVSFDGAAVLVVPLVIGVVVHPDDVEVLRRTAKHGPELPDQHVTSLELRQPEVLGGALRPGAIVARGDVNGRNDVNEQCTRVKLANGLQCCYKCKDKMKPELKNGTRGKT